MVDLGTLRYLTINKVSVILGYKVLDAEAWCSGLTCGPVKAEIAGSNPVASAPYTRSLTYTLYDE